MANIGLPLLAIEPSLTWCKLRTLHQQRTRWGLAVGPAMADKTFIDEIVKSHNEYRKRHQANPLSHSKELSAQAQKWADHLAATGTFQHSNVSIKGEKLGENIAMKWSSRPEAYTGQEVTDQWYSEVKMFQFGREPNSLSAGHFTQVVWRASREIGVGRAVARDGKIIVVANYRPAGNLLGSFSANVLPPKDGKIILPASTDSKQSFESRTGGPFAKRFEDMREHRRDQSTTSTFSTQTKTESRSTRTYTVTETVGGKKTTKTITEETIIKPDGEKIVNRKETVTSGEDKKHAGPAITVDFGRLALKDSSIKDKDEAKKSSGPFWKPKRRSSSSSSSSSPERGDSKEKAKGIKAAKPQKMSEFIEDCLKAHNAARSKHGVPSLKLAKDLSAHAQKWAEELAARDRFEHSKCLVSGQRVGENIACKWSTGDADYTGKEAVDQWYSEIKKHNFDSDGSMGSGHFTQVVWKDSKELGVGKAKTAGGKVIVVANYRPAGNLIGSYRQNVFRPK